MPINFFGKSFAPGKTPPRSVSLNNLTRDSQQLKSSELSTSFNNISLELGGHKANFKNGEWIAESSKLDSESLSELKNLRGQLRDLEEENNVLKLKIELLIDMVTEKTAEILILKRNTTDSIE